MSNDTPYEVATLKRELAEHPLAQPYAKHRRRRSTRELGALLDRLNEALDRQGVRPSDKVEGARWP